MDDRPNRTSDERFAAVYTGCHGDVYRYMSRRLSAPSDVADLVAETFAVVWRRLAELPAAPQDRLWVFGIARRVLSQHHRSAVRRERLERRLGALRPTTAEDNDDSADAVAAVQHAVALLRERDREVVRLILWDGLSHTEAAVVLGCSPNAVALRLHKAKQRLRGLLSTLDTTPRADASPEQTRSRTWTSTH